MVFFVVGCCVMLLYGVNRNDECVEGGESTIVDALAVVEKLRVTHPHHFATLVRVPTTFQRIHYERYIYTFVLDQTPNIYHYIGIALCIWYTGHLVSI